MSSLDYFIFGISIAFYAAGFLLALLALLHTRTPQGTFAWMIALVVFPYLSVPLYLIFGPKRFEGYIEARRNRTDESGSLNAMTQNVLADDSFLPPGEEGKRSGLFESLRKLVNLNPSGGNDCELLIDGEQAFPSMYEAIDAARHYILVEFFIIKSDSVGDHLRDLLMKKAREGVKVYVIYDEIGSRKLRMGYISSLREAGVNVSPFNGKRSFFRNIVRVNFRNHRKIVVADGRVCFIGGMNVGKEYIGEGSMGYWRDTVIKMEGPSVLQVQLTFMEDWHWSTNGEILNLSWTPELKTANRQIMILPSSPADPAATWKAAVIALANAAEQRIWIASPYFVPGDAVLAALQAAALRGVDVCIIKPKKADKIMVKLSSLTFIPDTLPYGIRMMEYNNGFMHQKVILVDEDIAAIGTANLDNRSLTLNFEITAIVHNHAVAEMTARMLVKDMDDSSLLSESDYGGKSFLFRILCGISRLMAPIQ